LSEKREKGEKSMEKLCKTVEGVKQTTVLIVGGTLYLVL
jgi:putative NADH-flavin reductase